MFLDQIKQEKPVKREQEVAIKQVIPFMIAHVNAHVVGHVVLLGDVVKLAEEVEGNHRVLTYSMYG